MHKRWLLSIFLLLAACSTNPRPEVGITNPTGSLLGIADVGSASISAQALVPGLGFSVVERSVVDADGIRLQEVTYQLENTSERDLSNLTLYAVDTPNTLAETNVSGLQDALGNDITNPDMAPSIVAVHGSNADNADMQAFTEADKIRVKALLDEMYPDNAFAVLSRGFVASNIAGQGNRAIAIGEQGVVTIAVQYPFDPVNPAGYPDSFTLTFAFVDEDVTRITQGDNESNEAFVDRVISTFDPLPDNLEVVVTDPQNPPQFDTPTTVLQGERPNPPIAAAPTTPELPQTFTLSVADLIVSADADVTVSINPAVRRTLVWE